MKVLIDAEEVWPYMVVTFEDEAQIWQRPRFKDETSENIYEIPDELVERYRTASRAYGAVRNEIAELVEFDE